MANDILHERLRAAVEKAGNQSRFARAIGTSQQLVSYWLKNGRPLPGEFAIPAENAGLGARSYLRPDLYPDDLNVQHADGNAPSGVTASPGKSESFTAESEAA